MSLRCENSKSRTEVRDLIMPALSLWLTEHLTRLMRVGLIYNIWCMGEFGPIYAV